MASFSTDVRDPFQLVEKADSALYRAKRSGRNRATFYDSAGVRCGEGLFKVDASAVGESAATDAPGLRLRCSPSSWRIVATNLLTRTGDTAKPGESASSESERPAPTNFVISIDGEEHSIQLNNPIVLQMGNRGRRIVLRSAP